jgi:DNA repair protein RadC
MNDELIYSKEYLLNELFALETANPVKKITSPSDILPAVWEYAEKNQEHFIVASLNGAHEVIETRICSIGLLNRTLVHPREIFRQAIIDSAAAIIIIHNHPSGNLEPSQEDTEITKRIKDAGIIVGIKVLDHIIISKCGYYSFLEEGKL